MHGSTGGGWKRNAGSRHRAGPRPNQPQNGDTMRFASACAESETQCHPVSGGGPGSPPGRWRVLLPRLTFETDVLYRSVRHAEQCLQRPSCPR